MPNVDRLEWVGRGEGESSETIDVYSKWDLLASEIRLPVGVGWKGDQKATELVPGTGSAVRSPGGSNDPLGGDGELAGGVVLWDADQIRIAQAISRQPIAR